MRQGARPDPWEPRGGNAPGPPDYGGQAGRCFCAFTKERHAVMRQAASEVQEHGQRARTRLVELLGVVGEVAPDAELQLIERAVRAVRVATLFNALVVLATPTQLRYETPGPVSIAGASAPVVQGGLEAVELPRVPARPPAVAAGSASLPAARHQALAGEADRAFATAQALKEAILAAHRADLPSEAGPGTLAFQGELAAFERDVKPRVARFSVAMARAKALRNELAAWSVVVDASRGDPGLRAATNRALASFDALAAWGSSSSVRYDGWLKRERAFRLLPGHDFGRRDLVMAGSADGRATLPLAAGPTMTTQELLWKLSDTPPGKVFELFTSSLPRVVDLSQDNGIKLANYVSPVSDQDRLLLTLMREGVWEVDARSVVASKQRGQFLQSVQEELDRRAQEALRARLP